MQRYDIAVIGGGPAGLAAATAAAANKSVLLINDGVEPGGQIWRGSGKGAHDPRAAASMSALSRSSVTLMSESSVVDAVHASTDIHLTVERRGAPIRVAVSSVVLATGARELFLPFPGWTLPNVMGAGGAQALAKGGMNVRGKRVVVAGSGPLLVAVASYLAGRGATIAALVEQAPLMRMASFAAGLLANPARAFDALRYASSIPPGAVRYGHWVSEAHGRDAVQAVTITDGRRGARIACDLLCTGYGLVPNTELAQLLGCEMTGDHIRVDRHQRTSIASVFAAGECAGIAGIDAALIEGKLAGQTAAGSAPASNDLRARDSARRWSQSLDRTFALRPEVLALARPDTIVCRCEDVRLGDIDRDWTSRQAKLYARVGMGPCQARVCGPALQRMRGWTPDRVRTPVTPSFVSTFASSPDANTSSGAR